MVVGILLLLPKTGLKNSRIRGFKIYSKKEMTWQGEGEAKEDRLDPE
jgi:hypothetical protein